MNPDQPIKSTGQFEQVVERLRSANNVLVTVTTNPTVDQLAACLGMTIVLNKMNKHATAVFSGKVPSTIDFLHPEKTLEKNTDSLRDFIISLDKAKADKLRYKVEDSVVKIFITPYKTSIDEKDLNFSQGDFNIDAVLAIGVHDRAQLDAAILAHGRILHDATVMSLDTSRGNGGQIGSISWIEPNASSLSEMIGDLTRDLSPDIFDEQISTALLTGIVSETDRFSNQKVTPHSMSIAGILMAAGASTQLVTTKLQEATKQNASQEVQGQKSAGNQSDDGLLKVDHDPKEDAQYKAKMAEIENIPYSVESLVDDKISSADESTPNVPQEMPPLPPVELSDEQVSNHVVLEPPKLGGQLTANSVPEYRQYTGTTDPLSVSLEDKSAPILNRNNTHQKEEPSTINGDQTLSQIEQTIESPHLHRADTIAADNSKTLREIEEVVDSPHLGNKTTSKSTNPPQVKDAREAVTQAELDSDYRPEPISALGAQPVDLDFGANREGTSNTDANNGLENNSSTPPPPPPPVPPPIMPPM